MTKDDIDEAVEFVIAARLARDVRRLTDAEDLNEQVVLRHCQCAVAALFHGLEQAAHNALAVGSATSEYSVKAI